MTKIVVVPGILWSDIVDGLLYSWKRKERVEAFCEKFNCRSVIHNTCSPFNVKCFFETEEAATYFILKYL